MTKTTQTPKTARKGFKYAGPTPDGGFAQRKTDNDYSHAVVVVSAAETVYRRGIYVPNPDLGQWVSYSWHGRYDLAVKSVEKARALGYRAVVVPVVSELPATPEKTTGLSESPVEPVENRSPGTTNGKEPIVARKTSKTETETLAPKKAAPKKKATPAAKPEAPAVDLHAAIVAAVNERAIVLSAKPSPTGAYVSYSGEGGKTLAYVQKQTKKGTVRVEVRVAPGKLPRSIRGFGANYMGNKATFGYLGHFDAKGVESVAAAIAVAVEQLDEAAAKKAAATEAAKSARAAKAAEKKAAAEIETAVENGGKGGGLPEAPKKRAPRKPKATTTPADVVAGIGAILDGASADAIADELLVPEETA